MTPSAKSSTQRSSFRFQDSSRLRHSAARLTGLILLVGGLCLGSLPQTGSAADRISLKEDVTDARTFQLQSDVLVSGQVYTKNQDGKSTGQTLKVKGRYEFLERRLSGIGRDARAYRSVRLYDKGQAEITVGQQASQSKLRSSMSLIMSVGESEGVLFFSPSGPLQFAELELLQSPGDVLAIRALLPDDPVEPGDEWKPPEWALQMLVGMEAAQKTTIQCRFKSIQDALALVTFTGEIEGATLGTPSKVNVEGLLEYDTTLQAIRAVTLTQKEKRSIGTVSPGLDLEAKVSWKRNLATDQARLSDKQLDALPIELNDAVKLVRFDLPAWGLRLYHDRSWHLFHQTSRVAILRLLDTGNLIAQCNIEALPKATGDQNFTLTQFEAEVRRALGNSAGPGVQSSERKSETGLTSYRVVATGQVGGTEMEWRYYLVRGTDGRQFVMIFVVEPKNIEALGVKDQAIVEGAELFAPSEPTSATSQPVASPSSAPKPLPNRGANTPSAAVPSQPKKN